MDEKTKKRAERFDKFVDITCRIAFGIADAMGVVLVALFGMFCGACIGTIDFDGK